MNRYTNLLIHNLTINKSVNINIVDEWKQIFKHPVPLRWRPDVRFPEDKR